MRITKEKNVKNFIETYINIASLAKGEGNSTVRRNLVSKIKIFKSKNKMSLCYCRPSELVYLTKYTPIVMF